MAKILFKNAQIVNRGRIIAGDLLVENGRIAKVGGIIEASGAHEIVADGKHLMPGIIDDQVHFREPGLTHKGDLYTEPRAAVAGGVTSFMEMPNVKPPTLTQELLAEKYQIAASKSLANYSFFMGASNDNLEEVLKTNPHDVCGIKIFMGSSTGNMLVDDEKTLEALFAQVPMLIATHCEDEEMVRHNEALMREKYGENVPINLHPIIRDEEACYKSSSMAVALAKKHNTRLHILHISTAEELALFRNDIPLSAKQITAEVCVHHLYFSAEDYIWAGTKIKCNPAVKAKRHREALLTALLDDRLDIIATDHAPHTWKEKQNTYFQAPSGVPLVQHSLNVMLEFYQNGLISLEKIVEKMCHAPAECFRVEGRGYLDEGAWADVILVDLEKEWTVNLANTYYKCAWTPFQGHTFQGRVEATVVSGHLAYQNGQFFEDKKGERLMFNVG
ncbi:dihydroorotase [Haliscomenobacter hydrossis]|uniref:Dihydroorotase, multifunctional complex type n=1 Tax=Haliscomenobacter hydrossis (strain ATCC 27775 / DSM 1100 / LMG 10767 / O) TaxID=760192 RepID=F4L2H5_HALH1|nr:dihydroorotase [Haliscomenobacter hydrossis]AEE53893.1 dihydroorotase, multifunctional complex type [Haliscomenobacter hydrossis DSM 1100]